MTDQDKIDRIYDALSATEAMFLELRASSWRYEELRDQHIQLSVINDHVWHHTSYCNADTTPIVDGDDVLDDGDVF